MALELEKFAKEKSSELMLRWDNNYPGKCSIGIYNFLGTKTWKRFGELQPKIKLLFSSIQLNLNILVRCPSAHLLPGN